MRGPDQHKVKIERRLRRQSTDAEMVIWLSLRDRRLCGFKFVRQEAVESFIVDFVCREKKLIIEVDGGQHSESAKDRERDEILKTEGYRVFAVLKFGRFDQQRGRFDCHREYLEWRRILKIGSPSPGPRLARATLSP